MHKLSNKFTLSLAVALATGLIGCSSEQLVEKPPNPINNETAVRLLEKDRNNAQGAATRHEYEENNTDQIAYLVAPTATESEAAQALPQAIRKEIADEKRMHTLAQAAVTPLVDNYPVSQQNTERYSAIVRNGVTQTTSQPTSTFSIDVDTGSYSNVRRFLNNGSLPPADAIRIEEMMNYFSYQYEQATDSAIPFTIQTEIAPTPWNAKTKLLHIGLQGYDIDKSERPAANLVFLVDVSGSMSQENKLPLLKSSIKMMLNGLTGQDHISIVVYAGASGVVLEPTNGDQTALISQALESLHAGGSTNGQAGIELAYAMAEKHKTTASINRIILATDGDFNVGTSDTESLKKLIEQKRRSGIALSTLGFGTGNYNDHLMEQLADTGNGAYAYIDTLNEARKTLLQELSATLLTIAKDVKIQIEFNPTQVSEYRLLGYSNRNLANEDFANDKVDAGEIGAGHSVTALYEIALIGDGGEKHTEKRYGKAPEALKNIDNPNSTHDGELAELRLRYKLPGSDTSSLITKQIQKNEVLASINDATNNLRFSSAVAGFAQLLFDGKYLENFNFNDVNNLAINAKGPDIFAYRAEFIQLNGLAEVLKQQKQVRAFSQKVNDEG